MRFLKGFLCGILLCSLIHGWVFGWAEWQDGFKKRWEQVYQAEEAQQAIQINDLPEESLPTAANETTKNNEDDTSPQGNKQVFLGMNEQELRDLLGEPTRVEPTPFGYSWWIYNQNWAEYIQIGIRDGMVNTFYTNSPVWGWENFIPGMPKEEWSKQWVPQEEVSFRHSLGFYTFNLTTEEQEERPLFVNEGVAVQLYVDIHNAHAISAIRVMDVHTLLLQRPYALKYIGELPDPEPLSDEDWLEIAKANEQQIFELVNIVREKQQLSPLVWHEHVANVARRHSADMLLNKYFDHYSAEFGDLGQRLDRQAVRYLAAGENIAWNYFDAPDAHEGWLNSLGHRKNILKGEFTHLGVGIVEKYYTQNFITY